MDQIISFIRSTLEGTSAWAALIAAAILTLAVKPLPANRLLSFIFWWMLALLIQKFVMFYRQKIDAYDGITYQIKHLRRYFAEGVDNNHDNDALSENRKTAIERIGSLRLRYKAVLENDPLDLTLNDFADDLYAAQSHARCLEITDDFKKNLQENRPFLRSLKGFFVK